MMKPTPSLLYRFLWLIALLCVPYVIILTIDLITHPFVPEFFYNSVVLRLVVGLLIAPITLSIGYLLIRRNPGNVVGPMLVLWGAYVTTIAIRNDISIVTMALLTNIASVGWIIIMVLGFFFPSGRVTPERWNKPITWIVLCIICATLLTTPASVNVSISQQSYQNPIHIPSLAPLEAILNSFSGVALLLLPLMVYSVYRRYKQSSVLERQQVKWLAFGLLTLFVITPVTLFLVNVPGFQDSAASMAIQAWFYLLPAVCVGNAILRHRLYDIDIIIRRTLIYAVLTGILAAVYFGGIILTQQLFRAATGESSDLAIVVSTLLIAALFTPVRRRVQDAIDRRLYRRKYDVEQTLADFQKNLREDVDMETLKANLVGVVNDTMQPSSVRLWVREVTK